ncbi:hypothetical protein ACI2LO_32175 [Streptomyces sp. NPDC033754]|uniref:hypothetical protein n=1 Tax=unclassified Streptomyces TaxID=2593676 RepID=UPI0033D796DA
MRSTKPLPGCSRDGRTAGRRTPPWYVRRSKPADTPALAALRQRIDDLGMFSVLDHFIVISPSPRQFAESLAVCLEPFFNDVYEALMEQLAENPGVFSIPGDESEAVGFGEAWMRALDEQTETEGASAGVG